MPSRYKKNNLFVSEGKIPLAPLGYSNLIGSAPSCLNTLKSEGYEGEYNWIIPEI